MGSELTFSAKKELALLSDKIITLLLFLIDLIFFFDYFIIYIIEEM